MTKTQILSFTRPSQLFSATDYKQEYRAYAKANHPDAGGDAAVMAQINRLYDMACKLDTAGGWGALDTIRIDATDYHYDSINSFELGDIYVSDNYLIYKVLEKYSKFLTKLVTKFRDDKMKAQELVPRCLLVWTDPAGDVFYILKKPAGSFLLKDVLNYCGTIDPKHVAWIISRMYNIGCLIQYNDLVHLDMSVNSILINPETHWTGLYGGWWYSFSEGERITKLPASTYKVLPYSSISSKEASFGLMNVQIRALARELLGARYGDNQKFPTVEPKFVDYITSAGSESVIDDYIHWDTKAIDSIFGIRKFVKWDLKKEQVYG